MKSTDVKSVHQPLGTNLCTGQVSCTQPHGINQLFKTLHYLHVPPQITTSATCEQVIPASYLPQQNACRTLERHEHCGHALTWTQLDHCCMLCLQILLNSLLYASKQDVEISLQPSATCPPGPDCACCGLLDAQKAGSEWRSGYAACLHHKQEFLWATHSWIETHAPGRFRLTENLLGPTLSQLPVAT